MPAIDLQAHSTISDGVLPPTEVVRLAAKSGVEVLALTDHDAVDGVPEALAAARETGIKLIPAAELSTVHPRAPELHILGYRIDIGADSLAQALARAQRDRVSRAHEIAARLAELGIALSVDDAVRRAGDARSLGRPHLAAAALADSGNRGPLAGVGDVSTFIGAYLAPGKPAFVTRSWPTAVEAIKIIRDAGGEAVWAHPFWDVEEPAGVVAVLDELQAVGLDGIEAFYPTHTEEQAGLLVQECDRRGLVMTASSDFHGPEHPLFSSFLAYRAHRWPGGPALPPHWLR